MLNAILSVDMESIPQNASSPIAATIAFSGPRERAQYEGIGKLATSELLALILSTGSRLQNVSQLSASLLTRFQNLDQLEGATLYELSEVPGIGIAKASRIAAALELGRRVRHHMPPQMQLNHPLAVHSFLLGRWDRSPVERTWLLSLNAKNQCIHFEEIARGGRALCSIDAADVFRPAIKHGAISIILAHNHPSGDPSPSRADIEFTHHISRSGEMIGIPLLDHLVISVDGFFSFRDENPFKNSSIDD